MSSQPAVEAAKIAAETAIRNAEFTANVTMLVAAFSFLGVVITCAVTYFSNKKNHEITKEMGLRNLESSKQKIYLDTISAERVKWTNTLRETASEFLKVTQIQTNDFRKWYDFGYGAINEKVLVDRSSEIAYLSNQINLLLNLTDFISAKLISLQNEVSAALSNSDISKFNNKQLEEKAQDIGYLYQVILRGEWKRIKEENKKGEEIDRFRMKEIYMEVAINIDSERYKHLFYVNKEKVPN